MAWSRWSDGELYIFCQASDSKLVCHICPIVKGDYVATTPHQMAAHIADHAAWGDEVPSHYNPDTVIAELYDEMSS